MSSPRPCSAAEAVSRALRAVAAKKGQYVLGTGDYRPVSSFGQLVDEPWTEGKITIQDDAGNWVTAPAIGSDCAGFAISWCYKLRRHRPGFNVGSWSSCSDDINCNSALEDAQHALDCFELVDDQAPQPGDLLLYPSFTLATSDGPKQFIGHVCIVTGVSRVSSWEPSSPRWDLLDVAQCHGPNGFKPGAVATDGSIWLRHDVIWPKPQHRSHLIRALP